ncbi:hypothetical protein E2562_035688 [Oryza meyeriana var. granulata]|uniref:Uncharacterized protein n=1 Tax=Oryza meyeriana var. granulata TaxID=110450 RepID=A0A6G1CWZ7_9ORYZ|nr:hypothetical protein E2562_035688 [Oryza meyeriana var. granulata]
MSIQHEAIYDDMPGQWLFDALSPATQSSRRGKKQKRTAAVAETASRPGRLQSQSPPEGRGGALAELESGGGSCNSYKLDGSSAVAREDDVVGISKFSDCLSATPHGATTRSRCVQAEDNRQARSRSQHDCEVSTAHAICVLTPLPVAN